RLFRDVVQLARGWADVVVLIAQREGEAWVQREAETDRPADGVARIDLADVDFAFCLVDVARQVGEVAQAAEDDRRVAGVEEADAGLDAPEAGAGGQACGDAELVAIDVEGAFAGVALDPQAGDEDGAAALAAVDLIADGGLDVADAVAAQVDSAGHRLVALLHGGDGVVAPDVGGADLGLQSRSNTVFRNQNDDAGVQVGLIGLNRAYLHAGHDLKAAEHQAIGAGGSIHGRQVQRQIARMDQHGDALG